MSQKRKEEGRRDTLPLARTSPAELRVRAPPCLEPEPPARSPHPGGVGAGMWPPTSSRNPLLPYIGLPFPPPTHPLPTHTAAAQPAGDCCRLMKETWPQPSGLEGSCFRHEGPGFESQIFHSRTPFPPVKKGPELASPLRVDCEEVCQVVCDRPCSRPRVQSPHTPGWLWGSQRDFGGKACHTEASHRSGGCCLLPKRGPGRGHPCLHTPHQLICGVGWTLDEGPQSGT